MVRIIEALNDDDKIVIFKQNGRYKATKKSNYVRRMMDANLVQDLKDFKSAEQIIDYYIKWYKGKLDEDDFIVVDDTKFERKLVGFYDMEDVMIKPYNEWKYCSVEDVIKESKSKIYINQDTYDDILSKHDKATTGDFVWGYRASDYGKFGEYGLTIYKMSNGKWYGKYVGDWINKTRQEINSELNEQGWIEA